MTLVWGWLERMAKVNGQLLRVWLHRARVDFYDQHVDAAPQVWVYFADGNEKNFENFDLSLLSPFYAPLILTPFVNVKLGFKSADRRVYSECAWSSTNTEFKRFQVCDIGKYGRCLSIALSVLYGLYISYLLIGWGVGITQNLEEFLKHPFFRLLPHLVL